MQIFSRHLSSRQEHQVLYVHERNTENKAFKKINRKAKREEKYDSEQKSEIHDGKIRYINPRRDPRPFLFVVFFFVSVDTLKKGAISSKTLATSGSFVAVRRESNYS